MAELSQGIPTLTISDKLELAPLNPNDLETLESVTERNLRDLKEWNSITGHHSQNVGLYCRIIGDLLESSKKYIVALYYAGLWHDVGKLKVPKGILEKPWPLSRDEQEIMDRHSDYGLRILGQELLLKDAHLVEIIKDAVRYHHANADGSTIPLSARIVSIADALEAMSSGRPYKRPDKAETIVNKLRIDNGHFDPTIVNVVLNNFYLFPRFSDGYWR